MRGVLAKVFAFIGLGGIGYAIANHFINQAIVDSKVTAEQAGILAAQRQANEAFIPIILLLIVVIGIVVAAQSGSKVLGKKYDRDRAQIELERERAKQLTAQNEEESKLFLPRSKKANVNADEVINI